MNKLKFHLINYKEITRNLNINVGNLQEYLNGGRKDILENFDIFSENVRSKNCIYKNFDIFEKTEEITDKCVIVLGLYVELLEFWGQRNKIYDMVKFYCKKYPNNKIIIQWNHDVDTRIIFNFIDEFKNLYILNFNTSINHKRFIILPFWTIDDELFIEEKKYFSNLVCSTNNKLRANLKKTFSNKSDFYVSEKINFQEYKRILSMSKFTLCPKGNGLSSYRFFECFHLNTIPVLFGDSVILPYEDRIDYNNFIIRIEESYSDNFQYIFKKLNSVNYKNMLMELNKVRELFTLKGVQEEVYKRLI